MQANYWFTRETIEHALSGFTFDDDIEARLLEVLTTIVRSITDGNFPAYPGAEGFFGPDNCSWCPYDRVCPRDRVRRFERRRDHPALASLLALREPEDPDALDLADAGGAS